MFKNSKTSFFIVIMCILFIVILGRKISYIVFYMLTGGIILSYILGRIGFKNIYSYVTFQRKDYYTGDNITVTSHLENKSILPAPYVEITDKTREKMSLGLCKPYINFLMPFQAAILNDSFKVKYRGIYKAGPLEVKYSDIMEFFEWSKSVNSNDYISVYPKYYIIQNFRIKSLMSYGVMSTTMKTHENSNDVSDIKKYSYGDSVKKIHWKISAKKGTLFVKNFELSGSASVFLFLDFNKNCFCGNNSRDFEEKSVETASTIIYYFLKKLVTVNVFVNASKTEYESGRNIGDFKKFLDLFCRVRPDGNMDIMDVISKKMKVINKGSSIIIITGFLDADESQKICSLKEFGYDVIVIYVNEFPFDDVSYSIFDKSKIEYGKINIDSDIKGVLENI